MELAAKSDRRSVAKAAACRKLGSLLGIALEVAAQPALTFPEEALDLGLGMHPATAGHWWDGDDQALSGIDRHPKAASPSRAAKRVGRQRAQRAVAGGIVIDFDGDTSEARRTCRARHLSSGAGADRMGREEVRK